MRVMRVELQLGGAQSSAAGIAALARQLQSLGSVARTARTVTRATTSAATRTANIPATPAPAALTRTQKLPTLNIAGPHQALAKAQSDLVAALHRGTVTQINDARTQLDRARARVDALYQASLGKTIKLPSVKPSKPFSVAGPSQRLQQAQDDLQKALAQGTASQIHDAELAVRKAQERLTRANRPAPRSTLGGRLANLVLSTRFNIGGQGFGVSPLVGRTLAAVGATGPQAAAVAGAVLAITAVVAAATFALRKLVDAVEQGADSLKQSANAGTVSGGTAGNIAGLRALQLDPGSIAGLAAGLRQARSSDPFAGAQFGFQLPRPFGGGNEAKGLQDVIEQIAAMPDPINRLKAAQLGQLDSILPLIEAMRRSRASYEADKKARAEVGDEKTLRAAQDLSFAVGRVTGNWDLLMQALSKPFLKPLTAMLATFADMLAELATELSRHPELLKGMVQGLQNVGKVFAWIADSYLRFEEMMNVIPKGSADKFDKWLNDTYNKHMKDLNDPNAGGASNPMKKHQDAMDRNTDAVLGLAGIIKGGTYGGGDRARGAFPAHLMPAAAGAGMNWRSLHMGFWSL